jgi:hypothetical protein
MEGNDMTTQAKMGRPSKYKPEYCEQVIEFFNKPPYEFIEVDAENDDGETYKTVAMDKNGHPIKVPTPLPTKERFAFSIGVHRSTLIDWANNYEDFSYAIKMAEDLQKDILVQNGLVQAYDKTFAIFVAKNVTDMSDKRELDHTSSDGSMAPPAPTYTIKK